MKIRFASVVLLVLLGGCQDRELEVYTVPKEVIAAERSSSSLGEEVPVKSTNSSGE